MLECGTFPTILRMEGYVCDTAHAQPPIIVEVLTGTIRYGSPLRLTNREREIAIAIAAQPHPAPTQYLCELLYPDRDGEETRGMLKLYVHRLRQRVNHDFIVRSARGYFRGPHVRVDIAELEPLVHELSLRVDQLSAGERERTLGIARALRAPRPAQLLQCDWYAIICDRFSRIGHDLAMQLARAALNHGQPQEAIRVARELTYEDPCDEEASELVIRAHLRAGQQGAAVEHFRLYRSRLAEEFQVSPSSQLLNLLRAPGLA